MTTKLEIFCGTGGVGKTTLSFCRAVSLAENGKKTLIFTIDPSKRLKDFIQKQGQVDNLDTKLVKPSDIFKETLNAKDLPNNRVLKLLMSNYAGMNEILSLVELQKVLNGKQYEYVILDTAPGGHFLDFLQSTEKIKSFFDKSFIEVLNYLNSKKEKIKGFNLFKSVLQTGFEKLLNYLERVTGGTFIQEFLDSLSLIYEMKDKFLATIELQKTFFDSESCTWLFVTSADQQKYLEAKEMMSHKGFKAKKTFAIINKSNRLLIENDLDQKNLNVEEEKVLNFYLNNELNVLKKLQNDFDKILEFEEIISDNLNQQVTALKKAWSAHDL